ncbi:MAG: hypothetical protein CMF50_07595 [Legionellales bacterium]|nr:hypothetical protein [Legionellales bacterium]
MDFTLSKYQRLLEACQATKHDIITMQVFFECQQPATNTIILRHDVDRRIKNALNMARLEARLGVKATYYFRVPYTFKPTLVEEIANLGHEVGFHYETLAKTKGDVKAAHALFNAELEQLRSIVDIKTICMHGSPLSPYDNRDLWQEYDFKALGIIGEPYLSIDYDKVAYVTDTGRSWGSDATNLRDRVTTSQALAPAMGTTEELINFVGTNQHSLIIQTHPERWAYSLPSLAVSYGHDFATNCAKRLIRLMRK